MTDEKKDKHISTFLQELKSPDVKSEFRNLIREILKEEIKLVKHSCRFNIPDEDGIKFGHYIGMLSDLGDGQMDKGIEVIRDNHKWLEKQRQRGDKLSMVIMITVVTSLVSGALLALGHGIKVLLFKVQP